MLVFQALYLFSVNTKALPGKKGGGLAVGLATCWVVSLQVMCGLSVWNYLVGLGCAVLVCIT